MARITPAPVAPARFSFVSNGLVISLSLDRFHSLGHAILTNRLPPARRFFYVCERVLIARNHRRRRRCFPSHSSRRPTHKHYRIGRNFSALCNRDNATIRANTTVSTVSHANLSVIFNSALRKDAARLCRKNDRILFRVISYIPEILFGPNSYHGYPWSICF